MALRNAINNRAHSQTHCAPCTIIRNFRNVSFGIEMNSLITGIVASHVAFTAIYAHVLKGNLFLFTIRNR